MAAVDPGSVAPLNSLLTISSTLSLPPLIPFTFLLGFYYGKGMASRRRAKVYARLIRGLLLSPSAPQICAPLLNLALKRAGEL